MEQNKKQDEGAAGAPEWMVTFSDCMTLLLTFFVLLVTFSSFDQKKFDELREIFCGGLPIISVVKEKSKDAFLATKVVQHTDIDEGSEKPTSEKGTTESGLKEGTEPVNFHNRKVFLISSSKVFWGRGKVISFRGRKLLSTLASFLKEMPDRVVISENGQEDGKTDESFGLKRAWAVIEYLTTKQGLDRSQFSIAVSTLQENLGSDEYIHSGAKPGRVLEIVLLERSIYN
ncbi:MAG: flagellar motor protein MotB [Planctomycetota bacterium]